MKIKFFFLVSSIFFLILTNIISQSSFAEEEKESAKVFFRDDFTGNSLRPEWALRLEDKDRWRLVDGEYFLIITTDAGKEKDNVKNELVFTKNMPRNYELVTKINAKMEYNNLLEIKLQKDKNNYLTVKVGKEKISFLKYLRGEESGHRKSIGEISGDLFIKITKKGDTYIAEYSIDNNSWTTVGTQTFLGLNGSPMFSAYNISTSYEKGPETDIKVDYFEIKTLSSK